MHTHRLDKGTDLLKLNDTPFGFQGSHGHDSFIRLPMQSTPCPVVWRLVLEVIGGPGALLPLEIIDDVILGRGHEGDDAPQLDLTALGAFELGVSRQHALLRPASNQLHLFDMGSSNGTFINAFPLHKGNARGLTPGDQISLGKLNLHVIFLQSLPGSRLKDLEAKPPHTRTF